MEIQDFNPWWKTGVVSKEFEGMRRRENFEEIKRFIDARQIIVITGLRRTGKTVLLHHLIEYLLKKETEAKTIVYFNFDYLIDDIEGILQKHKETTGIDYKKEKIYLFLDEIQKLEDWQNKVKIFYDLYPHMKFFVSGSSSLFIRKRTKESLAGRSFDFQISPLGFREYLQLKNKEKILQNIVLYKSEIRDELKSYIKTGGFPEIINETDDMTIKKYIKELIVDKIVYIDIPEVFNIEEPALLQTLIAIISSSPGMIVDYEAIANDLKRNRKTIANYLWYLEEAFLIKKVYNFSKNRLTSEKKSKKFYPASTALASLYDAEYGKLIESIILQNSHFKFFYRKGEKEVDFIDVDEEKKVVLPIEVKARKTIEKDAKKGLIDFMKRFKVKEGIMITEDQESMERFSWFGETRNIKYIPLWKWFFRNNKN